MRTYVTSGYAEVDQQYSCEWRGQSILLVGGVKGKDMFGSCIRVVGKDTLAKSRTDRSVLV